VLRTSDLEYELPEELIATVPAERRDSARLLVTGRRRGDASIVRHRSVRDLTDFLRAGDVLVFNTTRVIPARLLGVRRDTGGRVEGLYLGDAPDEVSGSERRVHWRVLLRAKRLRAGCVVVLGGVKTGIVGASLVLEREGPDGPGSWLARIDDPREEESGSVLARVGRTPLPPYILGARKRAGLEVSEADDRDRYQTVYARAEHAASVAAPTAGLHFTPELLDLVARMGVETAEVTLHVGTGTFKPVETEMIQDHPMHAEWCCAGPGAMEAIRRARGRGGRVIAVGTTSARAVESLSSIDAPSAAMGTWTKLLVSPGYEWQLVDGLLTNFHLPRSTLMALVAALLEGGVARLREIYGEAVRSKYRFYSYGDAMLVLD